MYPLLYHNGDYTAVLIDIPASIASAQTQHKERPTRELLSCAALEVPFDVLNEPKNAESRNRIREQDIYYELHAHYQNLIARALSEIRSGLAGPWCLPRRISPELRNGRREQHPKNTSHVVAPSGRDEISNGEAGGHDPPPGDLFLDLSPGDAASYTCAVEYHGPDRIDTEDEDSHSTPWHAPFHNAGPGLAVLRVTKNGAPPNCSSSFVVPPRSTCFLSDCADPGRFRAEFRNTCHRRDMPRRFDLLLLDPPWPNASARRKRSYDTCRSVADARELIARLDLDAYIARDGVLAVWVTNKPAARSAVLGTGGIFDQLGVGIAEEWIWVKTTKGGEPVTALDSLWRKPYEILLVGRAACGAQATAGGTGDVVRRVIAGVPDLHSRKPCLKGLLERLMALPDGYSAIEIFARHLVSGWWSWGNEAIRFNWDGHWATSVDADLKRDDNT